MMSSIDWRERLMRATEYRDLQIIFSELAAEARATSDGPGLALSIDEAIQRIEQERFRDEEDLRTFEREYEAFKQQQSGVVGWFKRHLPFTETRRLEKKHQGTVGDRRAEVLADNLIIARAQMLKEQLLPPETRRLGHPPAAWRQRLADRDSISQIQDYATVVRELGSELLRSHAFVKAVDADVQAFAAARFSDAEDRRRKDADLSGTGDELAALTAEIQSEEALRSGALKRLGELVEQELSTSDPSFRRLVERLALLETASRRAKDVEQTLDRTQACFKTLPELSAQLQALPDKRDQLARQMRELRAKAEDIARRQVHTATHLGEHRARREAGEAAVAQARAAADAANKAYQAEFGPTAELGPPEGVDGPQPLVDEVTRTQQAWNKAEEELRIIVAGHEAAQAEADRAHRDAEKVHKELENARGDEEQLAESERKLRDEVNTARNRLRETLERLEPATVDYLAAIAPLDRTSALREGVSSSRWPPDRSQPRTAFGQPSMPAAAPYELDYHLPESQERHARLLTAIRHELKTLTRELTDSQKQRRQTWKKRCRTLLGDDLATEVSRK